MPEERRMTITSSHLAPDDVARHTFATNRRGFDPDEVRNYLESIAAELRHRDEREHELLDSLADAERRAANPEIDEAMLTSAVGKETARVLQSGHDAAAELVATAQAEATRLVTEATEVSERQLAEAAEVSAQARSEADALLAERVSEAEAASASLLERTEQQVASALDKVQSDAEELTERARSEGRVMVEEAQQLRARVLADLSQRRKVLHAQIEQLRAGRERLAETVTDVRRSVDAIADELFNAENEARLAAEVARRDAASRPDEGTPEELATLLLAEEARAEEDAAGDSGGEDAPATDPPAGQLGGDTAESSTDQAEEAAEPAPPPVEQVDALFAKLRAAHDDDAGEPDAQPVSESEPADAGPNTEVPAEDIGVEAEESGPDSPEEAEGPPEDQNPVVVQRDMLVAPIVTALARRLKRTLQDDQNDLLDRVRASRSGWSRELLPGETEQLDALTTAVLPFLEQAADAGATLVAPDGKRPSGDALIEVAHELAEAVIGPLRRRLTSAEGLESAEESVVSEHIGSAFREWKGERIERLAGDHVVASFSLGSMATAGSSGIGVEWIAVSGPDHEPCPDCEDNGLNGVQAVGEAFPTGHVHPPAHPGCRCLLAPTTP